MNLLFMAVQDVMDVAGVKNPETHPPPGETGHLQHALRAEGQPPNVFQVQHLPPKPDIPGTQGHLPTEAQQPLPARVKGQVVYLPAVSLQRAALLTRGP